MSKEKNRQIVLTIGVPASGKSSWAKEYVLNNPDWVRVCRDEFRYALKNQQMCDPKIEDLITKLVVDTTRSALNKKLNVILDATHVRVKYIEAIIEEFKYEADIDYRVFDISPKKAIERDAARDKKVGAQVIEKMFESYKVLIDSFHFQPHKKISKRPVLVPTFESDKVPAVWYDVDGTIALMNGKRRPFDWHKVGLDDVNHIVVETIDYHRSKGRKIIIVSGRDSVCKPETIEWLKKNNIYFDEIFMRPEGDYRKDNVIKNEIYENDIKPKYNIICAYDDRLQVVRELYNMGIFTFSVNQGLIEF